MDLLAPFPLPAEDEVRRPDLRQALVKELFNRSRGALVLLTLVLPLLWQVLGEEATRDPRTFWLVGLLLVNVAARLLLLFFMDRLPESMRSPQALHAQFLIGSTVVGLAFGALNIISVPHMDPMRVCLLAVFQTGVLAFAMVSMAGSTVAYLLYMLPNLGALAWSIALHPPPEVGSLLLILALVYIIALSILSIRIHRGLVETLLAHLKLSDLALKDGLTGLRNRRFLAEYMEQEVKRVLRTWQKQGDRHPQSLAIMVLDLDFFKLVNDGFGHHAGDAVLVQLANILKEAVRKPDLVVRWGGEEFVVVAMDTERGTPHALAKRIQAAIRDHAFTLPSGEVIRKTGSIGYTFFPFLPERPDALSWEQTFQIADASLYLAKSWGRDAAQGILPGPADPERIVEGLAKLEKNLQPAFREQLIRLA
jgi:diguanylate cyclase (GGDEF)-like protein